MSDGSNIFRLLISVKNSSMCFGLDKARRGFAIGRGYGALTINLGYAWIHFCRY